MRRRYDVRYDETGRRYLVEVLDEQGQRRQVEAYPEWETADRMRSELNSRLQQSDELLPEPRR